MKLKPRNVALLAGLGLAAWCMMKPAEASAYGTGPLYAVVSKDHVILSTWLQRVNAEKEAAMHVGSFILRIR